MMDQVAHGHLLRSTLQGRAWFELWVEERDHVQKNWDVLKSEEGKIQRRSVFEVDVKELIYVRAPGFYDNVLWLERLQYMYVAECVSPFRWNSTPAAKMGGPVDYIGALEAASAHFDLANLVSNGLWVSVDQAVCEGVLTENSRLWMLLP